MNITKKLKTKIVLGCIIIVAIIGVAFYLKIETNKKVKAFSDTIEENVTKIAQLSTIQYNYTDVLTYKENVKYKGINIPFTGKSFLIKYAGYVKAGLDLQKIDINIKDENSIVIKLESSKILDNVINEEDVYVYDEKESVFNRLKISDVYDILVKEKKKTEKQLIEKGFLEEANSNAKTMIEEFLKTAGFTNIRIDFSK